MDVVTPLGIVRDVVATSATLYGAAAGARRFWARNRLSWTRFGHLVGDLNTRMSEAGFLPGLVVGIGRGGAITGAMLSGLNNNIPLLVLERHYTWEENGRRDEVFGDIARQREPEPTLLVAGNVSTGNTMRRFSEYLDDKGFRNLRRAAAVVQPERCISVDFYGSEVVKLPRFPWHTPSYIRDSKNPKDALVRWWWRG